MRHHPVTHPGEAVFGALADATRRAVLDRLRRGSLPAGRIAEAFPVSRPAVSQHLALLRRARLFEESLHGRNRVYRLSPGPLRVVDIWLNHYRFFWQASLANLKSYVEAEPLGERSGSRPPKKKTRKS